METGLAAMRVRDDWQRFSIAAILLLLIAVCAIAPPDCYRFQNGGRTRTGRMWKSGNQDRDQGVVDTHLCFGPDLSDPEVDGNSRAFNALLPENHYPDLVSAAGPRVAVLALVPPGYCCSSAGGRAPPSGWPTHSCHEPHLQR